MSNDKWKISSSAIEKDVVIIGGGAAGLFCAIEAGKRGRNVVLLEHADRIGKKIAISGGGRCNFTNLLTSADNFISANPHFCKSALARYTPTDFVSLVEKHGIAYHEKKLGQLFCDGSSAQIIEMLLTEVREAGVEIRCGSLVRNVSWSAAGGSSRNFTIETDKDTLISESLVVATGGLSIAALGATDFGYRLARQFGLTIVEPWPALVPFTLSRETLRQMAPLSGISLDALVSCDGRQFRENILFTHLGLSGPAILQISTYWRPGISITINLLPDLDAQQVLIEHENKEITLANLLSQFLPRRFALAWCALNFPSQPLKRYPSRELAEIAMKLNHWEIMPTGTEGYRKAEVTAGGILIKELFLQKIAGKKEAGLCFIFEGVVVSRQI